MLQFPAQKVSIICREAVEFVAPTSPLRAGLAELLCITHQINLERAGVALVSARKTKEGILRSLGHVLGREAGSESHGR